MSELAALQALSRETKALILVSEFEARRMPMFQLRAVLEVIVRDAEEKKTIVDMVENDLRASGYPADQISSFLTDLLAGGPPKLLAREGTILTTRKLRSPFAMSFESGQTPPPDSGAAPAEKTPAKTMRGVTYGPGFLPHTPVAPQAPAAAALAPTPAAAQPFFGKAVAAGPTPPPHAPTVQRRATFVFEAAPKPPPPPPRAPRAPRAPSQAEVLMPVGQKSLLRHEMIFGAPGGPAAPAPAPAGKPLILIADDDKRARMVFRLRVEEAGYATVECGNGEEAWQRIQQGGVALAVLDMKMPGLHGLEVLSNIADKYAGLPVVVCSAYDQLQDELVVQSYPKLRYLVKPIAPDQLVKAINELLAMPAQP